MNRREKSNAVLSVVSGTRGIDRRDGQFAICGAHLAKLMALSVKCDALSWSDATSETTAAAASELASGAAASHMFNLVPTRPFSPPAACAYEEISFWWKILKYIHT